MSYLEYLNNTLKKLSDWAQENWKSFEQTSIGKAIAPVFNWIGVSVLWAISFIKPLSQGISQMGSWVFHAISGYYFKSKEKRSSNSEKSDENLKIDATLPEEVAEDKVPDQENQDSDEDIDHLLLKDVSSPENSGSNSPSSEKDERNDETEGAGDSSELVKKEENDSDSDSHSHDEDSLSRSNYNDCNQDTCRPKAVETSKFALLCNQPGSTKKTPKKTPKKRQNALGQKTATAEQTPFVVSMDKVCLQARSPEVISSELDDETITTDETAGEGTPDSIARPIDNGSRKPPKSRAI